MLCAVIWRKIVLTIPCGTLSDRSLYKSRSHHTSLSLFGASHSGRIFAFVFFLHNQMPLFSIPVHGTQWNLWIIWNSRLGFDCGPIHLRDTWNAEQLQRQLLFWPQFEGMFGHWFSQRFLMTCSPSLAIHFLYSSSNMTGELCVVDMVSLYRFSYINIYQPYLVFIY